MAMTDWTIVRRSLAARLFSTVTTVVTVAVAVALMLVLLMMRHSAARAFERGSGNMHLLVSAEESPLVSVLNGIFYANPPRRPLPWARYERLAAELPLGANGFAVPTQLGDSFMGLPVLATTGEFFTKFEPDAGVPWRFAAGRPFAAPFEVVLGAQAARATGLKLGDAIHLTHGTPDSRAGAAGGAHVHYDFSYAVVGILAPTGGSHDRALFTDLTSTWVIHAHDRRTKADPAVRATTPADLIEGDRKITGVYLRLATREGSSTPANLPQIFELLRRDTTLMVAQPTDEIRSLFLIVSNVDRIALGIAAVVMVSGAVSVMLALYNSMEGRRRQIATFRVLGASRARIFGLVMAESAIVGVLGAAAGALLAVVGAQVVAGAMRARLGLVIDPDLPPRALVGVAAATVALAALAGVVPALVAYRTGVAKNLRPLG